MSVIFLKRVKRETPFCLVFKIHKSFVIIGSHSLTHSLAGCALPKHSHFILVIYSFKAEISVEAFFHDRQERMNLVRCCVIKCREQNISNEALKKAQIIKVEKDFTVPSLELISEFSSVSSLMLHFFALFGLRTTKL